jgi:hypothetical protein
MSIYCKMVQPIQTSYSRRNTGIRKRESDPAETLRPSTKRGEQHSLKRLLIDFVFLMANVCIIWPPDSPYRKVLTE